MYFIVLILIMKLIVSLILCLTSQLHAQTHPLPKQAVVKILKAPEDKQCKEQLKLEKMSSEADVRKAFKTYKVVDGPAIHNKYIWVDSCMVTGSILSHKKVFNWKWRIGNLLETDYPDGVNKTLGGHYTDE